MNRLVHIMNYKYINYIDILSNTYERNMLFDYYLTKKLVA